MTIDAGAAKALKSGKSLLPAGVTRVEGEFARGDCVAIRDESGRRDRPRPDRLRREARRAHPRPQFARHRQILGAPGRAEMIHRDDMALTER